MKLRRIIFPTYILPIHTDDVASGLVITQYSQENNQKAGRPISELHCLLSNLHVCDSHKASVYETRQ